MARAISFYRSPEPIKALPFVEAAVAQKKDDPAAANLKAAILLKSRRFVAAETAARRAVALDSNNASNHLALGHSLLNLGRIEESKKSFEESLRLDPGSLEAMFQLGVIAQKRGDQSAAVGYFEQAAAKDAQFGNVAFKLGTLYARQGRASEGKKLMEMFRKMDAATSAYETALSQLYARPNDPGIHYKLARFHLDALEFPQAIAELKKTLELNPAYPQAKRDLIHALMRHGRATEARAILQTKRQSER
jgi:tetratricopeptide (TPR) repeat protein